MSTTTLVFNTLTKFALSFKLQLYIKNVNNEKTYFRETSYVISTLHIEHVLASNTCITQKHMIILYHIYFLKLLTDYVSCMSYLMMFVSVFYSYAYIHQS
jgi:hypothetical protein